MAKDDYSVIVFKILSYLYGCLKKGDVVDGRLLSPYSELFKTKGEPIPESYWNRILWMMKEEKLIDGLTFIKAFGGERILASEISDCYITPTGIHYLEENSTMRKVFEVLKETKDIIVPIVSGILPF